MPRMTVAIGSSKRQTTTFLTDLVQTNVDANSVPDS